MACPSQDGLWIEYSLYLSLSFSLFPHPHPQIFHLHSGNTKDASPDGGRQHV